MNVKYFFLINAVAAHDASLRSTQVAAKRGLAVKTGWKVAALGIGAAAIGGTGYYLYWRKQTVATPDTHTSTGTHEPESTPGSTPACATLSGSGSGTTECVDNNGQECLMQKYKANYDSCTTRPCSEVPKDKEYDQVKCMDDDSDYCPMSVYKSYGKCTIQHCSSMPETATKCTVGGVECTKEDYNEATKSCNIKKCPKTLWGTQGITGMCRDDNNQTCGAQDYYEHDLSCRLKPCEDVTRTIPRGRTIKCTDDSGQESTARVYRKAKKDAAWQNKKKVQ